MFPDDAGKYIDEHILVTREDIARAKAYIVTLPNGNADPICTKWLKDQGLEEPRAINTESADVEEILSAVARAYSLRKAFCQALFELSGCGEVIFTRELSEWRPNLSYNTPRGAGGIEIKTSSPIPTRFERIALPEGIPSDPDIFLIGIDCQQLQSGIREAVEQALVCFRKGLYMPATAMLAAASEATWTECGIAVAKNLGDAKLDTLFGDQYSSISKKVTELRKALEQATAKPLLKAADQNIAKVNDAEVWTTVLRDRRNALHWGKAKSFIADHSETATLLIAAPLHIATLEAIRIHC